MSSNKTLNATEIRKILPHRYPFLLVDKILDYHIEKRYIIGQKNTTINEVFFQGHFPEAPIMPGVLIVEALAQTGGLLVHLTNPTDRIAVLLTISNAKFRKPVHPGDILILKCENLRMSAKAGRVKAAAYVNELMVMEGEVSFALVNRNEI